VRPTLHVIANPRSAGGRTARLLPRIRQLVEQRGTSFDLHTTTAPGHATTLAREAAEAGVERVLVVGGDGTLHEVVNGLLSAEGFALPKLAVCPMGTGNDFFRMVRTGKGLELAVNAALGGTVRSFDVGRVRWEGGERYFVNLCGLGIDVEVLRRRSRFARLPGLLQYLAGLGAAALRFQHPLVQVEMDGPEVGRKAVEARVLLAAVTVGPSVAGGIRLSPEALPDDGLLDLFLADGLGLMGIARHLPKVLRGKHSSVPELHMHQIRRARIRSLDGAPFAFELDGELMPDQTPWIEVEVVPGRLPVLEAREPSTLRPAG
jgi:diacylglycerol kinase (ATP)